MDLFELRRLVDGLVQCASDDRPDRFAEAWEGFAERCKDEELVQEEGALLTEALFPIEGAGILDALEASRRSQGKTGHCPLSWRVTQSCPRSGVSISPASNACLR